MYADYAFYTDEFFGTSISEESFPHLSLMASQYIDYITMGKAKNYTADNAVKLATCAVAECLAISESAKASQGEAEKKSESVGSWSASYYSYGESAMAMAARADTVARQYLLGTGLLYRGRCFC